MWQELRAVLARVRKGGLTACKEAEAHGTEVYRVELVLVPGIKLFIVCGASLSPSPSPSPSAVYTRLDSTAQRTESPGLRRALHTCPPDNIRAARQRRRPQRESSRHNRGTASKARGRRRWPTAMADGDGRSGGADLLAAQQPEDEARVPCQPCGPFASARASMRKMRAPVCATE